MTKVRLQYQLAKPVDDSLRDAIDRAHGVYGLQMVKLNPSLDSLTVEFDASRLTPDDVSNALRGIGLPVVGR